MTRILHWHFPLPRTHTGIPLGNGVQGALLWGEGQVLRITVGRADFWDHRGGIEWTPDISYRRIRACLERGAQKALAKIFSPLPAAKGEPKWPTVLPLGRIEIVFDRHTEIVAGALHLTDGCAQIELAHKGQTSKALFFMDMAEPLLIGVFPPKLSYNVREISAWGYVGRHLSDISFKPPTFFHGQRSGGWVQERPADPPLCLAWRKEGEMLALATAYGTNPLAARQAAENAADSAIAEGATRMRRSSRWWRQYWQTAAKVSISNERLAEIYDFGMYKFAGLTNPTGVPATLQGPWIEEYQMPPWSSDYHFNINVQMCYWPAYHGNLLSHLRPLFTMIEGWQDRLRHNARCFLAIADGLMLPHAVDDRCTCIGGYWAGTIDHGSTAWVAQMMYRYYRYTMDRDFLRRLAYPFMVGAMRVYEEMLERRNGQLRLPVSVSPEYVSLNGAMWGPNASFQLACLHRLIEDLLDASQALGMQPKRCWREIARRLPRACLIADGNERRIAIWEGMDLEISHRHHSHLAAIVPFDTIDWEDETWRPIVAATINRWILRGPGLWSGWCVPWAAMIHARLCQGEAAQMLLEIWQRVFTNLGRGTLHDADIPGFTLFGAGYSQETCQPRSPRSNEIMQMDAGMAAAAAVQEMLLHTRRGVNRLFAGVPAAWREASFQNMRTDGGFLVSAWRESGRVGKIEIKSPYGGVFRFANPWSGKVSIQGNKQRCRRNGRCIALRLSPGETVTITEG